MVQVHAREAKTPKQKKKKETAEEKQNKEAGESPEKPRPRTPKKRWKTSYKWVACPIMLLFPHNSVLFNRIACADKIGVESYGPVLPDPPIFVKNKAFREYFLTKSAHTLHPSSPPLLIPLQYSNERWTRSLAFSGLQRQNPAHTYVAPQGYSGKICSR